MSDLLAEVRAATWLPAPDECRAIRERAHVSQDRLAEELGVHRVTLARWETGVRTPRGELRVRYSRLLRKLQAAVKA